MIADVLCELNEGGELTVKEVAHILGITTSTVYRMYSGEIEPRFTQIRSIMQFCKSIQAKDRLMDCLVSGTAFCGVFVDPSQSMSLGSALQEALQAAQDGMSAIQSIHKLETRRMHSVHGDDARQVSTTIRDTIRHLLIAEHQLSTLAGGKR